MRVDRWEGLLVDYLKQESIHTIVKGLRSAVDFDYEVPMAQMNRALADVETVFLLTDPPVRACLEFARQRGGQARRRRRAVLVVAHPQAPHGKADR